ncbi:MAG: ABC transporter permease, partial [Planctomycetota bacterium]
CRVTLEEAVPFLLEAVRGHKLRSVLTILGIVIGISSVVLLSSIGEGTKQAIASEFSQFGTTMVTVAPGKSETMGAPGALTGTTRPLTIEDALALKRIPGVRNLSGNCYGVARVERGAKGRDVYTYGVMGSATDVWRWPVRYGQFIPDTDPYQAPAVCVLGQKLAKEIFGEENPLGKGVRIGEARFVVTGIMSPKGMFLGFDLDDAAFIPVVRAMRLFNRNEIHEINVDIASYEDVERVEEQIKLVLTDRHDEEDFTIISQKAMLDTISEIMDVITQGVTAIAGIAIFVGAIGILTITWVSVNERTGEIGLMKAVGASNAQVMTLFLGEATVLATLGGLTGILLGVLGGLMLESAVPGLRVNLAPGIVPICLGVSFGIGALAGWLPARRAAALDPVIALREE